jgi:hypothetical protein
MTWKLHVKSLNTLLKLEPQLQSADERTLSVYLPVRAEGFDAGHYDLLLNHAAQPYRQKLEEDQRRLFDAELLRVRTHLKVVRPAGCPALVVFANVATGLLTLIRLPETIEARVELGPPLLAPLELMLTHFPPAIAVVVAKREARTYASVLGEVIALEHMTGQDVRHSRAGGTSASSNQRKADNRTRANLKRVVEILDREVARGDFGRIFVAGPDEARAELLHELPKSMSGLVAGTISASLETPPGRLLEDIREQIARVARVSPAA